MEFEKYDSGKHEEFLPDFQKPHYKEGEVEKFVEVAREAVEELKSVVDFDDSDIKIVLGLTDIEKMREDWGRDIPDSYYFLGFSFADGMKGYEGNAVFMRVSDSVEDWRKGLIETGILSGGRMNLSRLIRSSCSKTWIAHVLSVTKVMTLNMICS